MDRPVYTRARLASTLTRLNHPVSMSGQWVAHEITTPSNNIFSSQTELIAKTSNDCKMLLMDWHLYGPMFDGTL